MSRRAGVLAAAALVGAGCLRDSLGPGGVGRFSLSPVFEGGSAGVVDFDRLRVTLTRPGEAAPAVDTTITLAATAESVVVDLRVPINGPSEDFLLVAVLLDVLGQEVFRAGPVPVTLRLGGSPASVVATFRYTGTGANAAAVRIRPPWRDTTLFFNDSLVLVADAFDSAGRPIAGVPITWTSLDAAKLVVRRSDAGLVVAASQRGAVSIEAGLLTGQTDTGTVTVQPRPSALGVISGNGQAGVVATVLAESLVTRVTGPDGLEVRGVLVAFAAAPGGGVVDPPVVPTDASGRAAASWTLGLVPGIQGATATVAGLSPVSFTATATLPPAVVFGGDSSGGLSSGVFRVNTDGSDRFRMDDRGRQGDVHPRSSPDRRRVGFTFASPVGTNELIVAARTGDTSAVLVSDTSARRARWSPDGVRLAFECGDAFSPQQDVCVIPDVSGPIPTLDGKGNASGKTFVTDFDARKPDGPGAFAWDPRDPTTLVVVRDSLNVNQDTISRLYTVLYDRSVAKELGEPLEDPTTRQPLRVVSTLDWSEDGSTIVFAVQDPLAFDLITPTGQRLYLVSRDGTGLRQLTKGPAFDARPVFSPDGKQVLFIRDANCNADYWRVEVASGAEERVSAESFCDIPNVLGHDWSPDGKSIVLVGSGGAGNFVIYRVPAGTTAGTYFTDRVVIGRGVDPGGFVTDIQPSWRP